MFAERINQYRYAIAFVLVGIIFLGSGIFLLKSDFLGASVRGIVILDETESSDLVVEISGEVAVPGVYKLPSDSRVNDALAAAGGITENADSDFLQKTLNRASFVKDGQKIYIPSFDKHSNVLSDNASGLYQSVTATDKADPGGLTNINTASLAKLEDLPGIGPVYAQKIIEYRPYSNTEELKTRSVLGASVYGKIKDLITVY